MNSGLKGALGSPVTSGRLVTWVFWAVLDPRDAPKKTLGAAKPLRIGPRGSRHDRQASDGGPLGRPVTRGRHVTGVLRAVRALLIPVVGGDKLGGPYGLGAFVMNVSVGSMDRAWRGT